MEGQFSTQPGQWRKFGGFPACRGGNPPNQLMRGGSPHLPPSERQVEGWDWGEKRTFSFRSWLEGRSKQAGGEDTDVVLPPWPQPRAGCKPPRRRQSGISMPGPCLGCPLQTALWEEHTSASWPGRPVCPIISRLKGETPTPRAVPGFPRGVLGQGLSLSRGQGTQW